MNQVEEALKEILEHIPESRNIYLSNEQAVSAQLIEPVLIALGWKTSNPKFVRHNAAFDDGKIPDYTLLKDLKNILIVEAKNLSVKLTEQKVIDQLSNYCYKQGVDFGILTNGLRWLLFNTFQKNPRDRIVWEVDLEKENIETVSRMLSSFAFENIDKLDTLLQISKTLEEHWKIISSADNIVKIISQKLNESIRATNSTLRIDQSEINSFTKSKLTEYFELNEIEEDEQSLGTVETISKETVFSEVEDLVFKRKIREKIIVIFPDNTQFYFQKFTDTFV